MSFIRNRMKEASTWAAIGILFQVARATVPPQYHGLVDCASLVLATVAGVTPEAHQ